MSEYNVTVGTLKHFLAESYITVLPEFACVEN